MAVSKLQQIPVLERKKRVAAYARVSAGKDAMLHSLSAQISYYSRYIQSHPDWLYMGVYIDEAVTGTKEMRPDFQRLIADCRAGKIDMIITKSISRFARNTVTLLETVRELKALGIDVYFEEPHIHTLSAAGELMLTVLASVAQEESRMTSERMKWRVRYSFEHGELANFRFLYGYDIYKGKIRINEREAVIVREVFDRVIRGDSLSSIAGDLNRRKVSSVFGGEWTGVRIRQMVANEKYTGCALLQKRFRNNHIDKHLTRNQGELPMYYAEDTHDAIIDKDTYEAAQAVLKTISEATPKKQQQFSPFTGMIRCEKCNKNYKHVKHNGYIAWNCSTTVRKGSRVCKEPRIPEEVLIAITADVTGLNSFDKGELTEVLDCILAKDHLLTFCFKNGKRVKRLWEYKSRKDSWTPEMRNKAREKAQEQLKGKEV